MYLSQVLLDMSRRDTMRALGAPNLFHGAIETCFFHRHGEHPRNLWRVDQLGDAYYLLILSEETPKLEGIVEQFGDGNPSSAKTRDYKPFLAKLKAGDHWCFRLRANPIRNIKRHKNDSGRGMVVAHVTRDQQKKWLLERAEHNGFVLHQDSFDVVNSEWRRFSKNRSGHKISLKTATFEGILTIEVLDLFDKCLRCGLGRGKAYGCGLLTLTPLRGYGRG